MILSIIKTY
jgi:hypothetical protein